MTQERGLANDPVSFDELCEVNEPVVCWATKLGISFKGYVPSVEVFVEYEGKTKGLYLEVVSGTEPRDWFLGEPVLISDELNGCTSEFADIRCDCGYWTYQIRMWLAGETFELFYMAGDGNFDLENIWRYK